VKDWVEEAHRPRKLQPKGGVGYLFNNLEGAEPLVVEFLRRSSRFDVLCIEPNLSTWNK
jgi:hypothetical protein